MSVPTPGIAAGLRARTTAGLRVAAGLLLCTALSLSLLGPLASADDLTNLRDQLKQRMASTRSNLNESSAALAAAALAVDRTEISLASARTQLAATKRRLAAAQLRDHALAAKLHQARTALDRAQAAVTTGQAQLNAQHVRAGDMVRYQFQQHTDLLPIAVLLSSSTAADLQTRLQWSETMFDTAAAEIDRLETLQRQLTGARVRATTLERQVAHARGAAAAQLTLTRTLTRRAEVQTANVAALLQRRRTEQAAAQNEVAADRQQYARLEVERQTVERRIAARIAAAKAAEARRIAAAKAAAQRAAAARIQAAHRAAAARAAAREARIAAAAKAAAARRAKAHAARIRAQRAHARAVAAANRAEAQAKAAQTRAHRAQTQAQSKAKAKARPKPKTKAHRSSSSSHRSTSSTRRDTGSGSSSQRSASHGFSMPVNGPITSPYGMRFHPILHYWKLHDGTDFGASCGTRIRAPYPGRVAERYFSHAYGNRLMIDHGTVDGRFVTTGYNHASRYIVHVGQHVGKGQVIGYVGSTGYATGCHLHLMVWLDGRRMNPMTWF